MDPRNTLRNVHLTTLLSVPAGLGVFPAASLEPPRTEAARVSHVLPSSQDGECDGGEPRGGAEDSGADIVFENGRSTQWLGGTR